MLALKQKNYNRGINLLSLRATGVRNVWIEILLSSCWLQTKAKYSFGEQAGKVLRQPSGQTDTGWPRQWHSSSLPRCKWTQIRTVGAQRGDRPAPMCRHPNEFHVRSIKRLLDQWNWLELASERSLIQSQQAQRGNVKASRALLWLRYIRYMWSQRNCILRLQHSAVLPVVTWIWLQMKAGLYTQWQTHHLTICS